MNKIQDKIKITKSELIGRTLTDIYHTKQDGPQNLFDEQVQAYYFTTVIELDKTDKYAFGDNWIEKWTDDEELLSINPEDWQIRPDIQFKEQKIRDIAVDEYDQIYFRLNNDIIIYHSIDLGSQLFVISYWEMYDEQGRVK